MSAAADVRPAENMAVNRLRRPPSVQTVRQGMARGQKAAFECGENISAILGARLDMRLICALIEAAGRDLGGGSMGKVDALTR